MANVNLELLRVVRKHHKQVLHTPRRTPEWPRVWWGVKLGHPSDILLWGVNSSVISKEANHGFDPHYFCKKKHWGLQFITKWKKMVQMDRTNLLLEFQHKVLSIMWIRNLFVCTLVNRMPLFRASELENGTTELPKILIVDRHPLPICLKYILRMLYHPTDIPYIETHGRMYKHPSKQMFP